MSSIGFWEILIVVVIALLVFGPKKLPELGSSIGRSITGFKQGLRETTEDIQSAVREEETTTGEPATGGPATGAVAATATTEAPATVTAADTTEATCAATAEQTTEADTASITAKTEQPNRH